VRFLIDEDLPRSTANLLRQYSHEAIDVRDIGYRGAQDIQIAEYARASLSSSSNADRETGSRSRYARERTGKRIADG